MNITRAQSIVSHLLEADPDEVDPRATVGKLQVQYWVVSFDDIIDPQDGQLGGADYPVIALSKEDATEIAKVALKQMGFGLDDAIIIDVYTQEQSTWNELKQVWDDIAAQLIDMGKYGSNT